jgi:hypothetical protein
LMASAPTGYARRPYAVDTSALRPSHSLRRTGVSSPIAPQRHIPGRAKKQLRCHAFFLHRNWVRRGTVRRRTQCSRRCGRGWPQSRRLIIFFLGPVQWFFRRPCVFWNCLVAPVFPGSARRGSGFSVPRGAQEVFPCHKSQTLFTQGSIWIVVVFCQGIRYYQSEKYM